MNKDLTILIPVRDEEENVKIISKEITDKIFCKNYEILFVNDFSQDRTEDVILDIMKNEASIRYINNQKKGLGGAIQAGIKASEGKFVCIMMSDSSDTVEDLNTYYNTINSNDVTIEHVNKFDILKAIVPIPLNKSEAINRYISIVGCSDRSARRHLREAINLNYIKEINHHKVVSVQVATKKK